MSATPQTLSSFAALGDETRATLLTLYAEALERLPATVIAMIVLLVTVYAARVAARSADALGGRILRSASLRILFTKTASVGTWLVGVLAASLFLFPGLRLGDIVATLGLGSVAIGFAFQDIFKNFLAGILLLINEPFRIGDAIVVDTLEGVVEHIDIRTTNVRTYTGERILIPNSVVFTSSVRVRTAMPMRRTDLVVGVGYDTALASALELARMTVAGVEGVLAEPAAVVDASDFGESAIDLTLRYWTKSQQPETLRTRTRVVLAIKAAFDDANISIPFPIRTVLLAGAEQGER
jgi:small-conductance mechanosensitive channel